MPRRSQQPSWASGRRQNWSRESCRRRYGCADPNSACGSGTTVSIGINNGQVASSNPLMCASGRVANAGNISVTLTSGIKRAVGSGRLTATSGSGTWTAQRI
jgi:hypothetical protein